MIIVSGTKRSGTSMWMQILQAAGYPIIGEAFPLGWRNNLAAANPRGFFESRLRNGIYYRTNPNPETGTFLFPADVERHVVKVFLPGLIRSDMAYIGHVIAAIRPWREYVASVRRLQAIEADARAPGAKQPLYMHPALEWWAEMFALICDVSTRRYSVHVQSYGGLLADPRTVIRRVLDWLGGGELEPAVAAVNVRLRTQDGGRIDPKDAFDPEVAEVSDKIYACLHAGQALDPALLARMNEVNDQLKPRIRAEFESVRRDRLLRRGQAVLPAASSDFDLMEGIESVYSDTSS